MKRLFTIVGLMLSLFGVQAQAQSLSVWADDITINADGQTVTYLTVKMTDNNQLYSGFQMAINVPEGITIAQKRSGRVMVNDAELNAIRFEGLKHSLGVNMPDATTIKVACLDTSNNEEFYRDDAEGSIVEELFTIGLVGDPEMVNGEYSVTFSDVLMIHKDASADAAVVQPVTLTVTGGQITSNIKGVSGNTNHSLYDLNGRKLNAHHAKGVVIENGKKIAK